VVYLAKSKLLAREEKAEPAAQQRRNVFGQAELSVHFAVRERLADIKCAFKF
jgi:hypothetical protein